MKRLFLCFLCITLTLLTCSCTMVKFSAADKERTEQPLAATTIQNSPQVPVSESPDDALLFDQTLTNQAGTLLASYSVKLPQFAEQSTTSAAIAQINNYYKNDFEAFPSDCARFFDIAKTRLGAKWDGLKSVASVQSFEVSYSISAGTGNYVSVLRTYDSVDAAGQATVRYYGDVFLLDTGWRLKFGDVFSKNTLKAQDDLVAQVNLWCKQNNFTEKAFTVADIEMLTASFALSETQLILCLEPHELALGDASGHMIRLPLSMFESSMAK